MKRRQCEDETVSFFAELEALLPADVPNREECVARAARHLEMIVATNEQFNLTRILSPREGAIKHVVDSLLPWKLFAGAAHVVDAGSGAGFPGIPLAIALPETRFSLLESTQKKARFIESTAGALELQNVRVYPERAEDWLKRHRATIVTARAVAPLERAVVLFAPALRAGLRVLLYKGPDAEQEIAVAQQTPAGRKYEMRIVQRYALPDEMGTRTIVEMASR